MADEAGSEGGRGTGETSPGGSGSGEGSGDRPRGDGAPGEQTPKGLDPGVLPEFLRGKNDAEVKWYLDQAFSSVESQNDEIRRLRRELAERRDEPPPSPPDPDSEKPLEELILENPDKALSRWAESKGLIRRFDSLEEKVGTVSFKLVEDEYPGVKEKRGEILKILKQAGTEINEHTITMAYKMLIGEEALDSQRKKMREALSSEEPPTDKKPEPEKPELSEIERQFARAQGMTEEEFAESRERDLTSSLKLPTG